ncbi:MAG: hypothetical protein U1E87_01535 [Alphaproteobacteria bacterium]
MSPARATNTPLSLRYPNEPLSWAFTFRQIGENFAPALGFVNRTGIRAYNSNVQRLNRLSDSWLAFYFYGVNQNLTSDLDGREQSSDGSVFFGAANHAGDALIGNFNWQSENVPMAFGLGGPATVLPGHYTWRTVDLFFDSSYGRKWILTADVECCDFYDGNAVQVFADFTYRPNDTWEIIPRYRAAYIDLPTGSVSIHVGILDLNLNFTPDMQIKTEAQYDNLSHNLNFFARYRWEFRPGSEFFVAVGENALITNRLWHSHYASQTSQASIRIGHTMRF